MRVDPLLAHTLLEALAYAVGARLFWMQRRRLALPALADGDSNLWLVAALVLGAALGSKLAYWLEDPYTAFAAFPDLRHLLQGKSIVGGLLGGLVAVEFAKRRLGIVGSTGDAFVLPLAVGMSIGRVGCFLAGLADHTFGLPTSLPWGVDFGDGLPRHPTQLYEIAFLVIWTCLLWPRRRQMTQPGDAFRLFLAGYLRRVEASLVIRDNRVYMDKWCPRHGRERVLVADNAEYYWMARERFIKPPELPPYIRQLRPRHARLPVRAAAHRGVDRAVRLGLQARAAHRQGRAGGVADDDRAGAAAGGGLLRDLRLQRLGHALSASRSAIA